MLEPIVLSQREREFMAVYEKRKQQAASAFEEAENAQKAFALCVIERANGDPSGAYQLSEDKKRLVPVPTAGRPELVKPQEA